MNRVSSHELHVLMAAAGLHLLTAMLALGTHGLAKLS